MISTTIESNSNYVIRECHKQQSAVTSLWHSIRLFLENLLCNRLISVSMYINKATEATRSIVFPLY